jgi:hypothetical protein
MILSVPSSTPAHEQHRDIHSLQVMFLREIVQSFFISPTFDRFTISILVFG